MTALSKVFRTATFRLSLIYVALFCAAAAAVIAYIHWRTQVLLARQLENTIQAELQGLAEQYNAGGLQRLVETIADRSATPGNSLYLVTDGEGRRIAGNLKSITPALWNAVGRVEFIYRRPAEGGPENRLAFASIFRLPGDFRLLVGRDIEDRREFERIIRSAFLWGLGFIAFAGASGAWVISRRLLERIGDVTATSQTIMAGDLSGRVPVTGSGDELDRLAESLNAMLERIEQLMASLREVSDNIAHDLKTPLNRLRNRVEAALRDPRGAAAFREALAETIEEADELIRTFDALLSIARLEGGARGGAFTPFDLSKAVRDVVELYEPLAEERGLRLLLRPGPPLMVRGEPQLIAQALANLIDNAIKYAAPDDNRPAAAALPVEVSAAERGRFAEITVADAGPGIPSAERERVLKRFVRLETSRSKPGSGLGLSLAAAVARLHGGEVRLEDNGPGLKAVFQITRGMAAEPGAA